MPLLVVFHTRPWVAGVSFEFSLYVMGFFLLAQSLLDGWIQPSLLTLIDHIRKGSLDYVLLRPVDAQWFVSTSRIVPVRFFNLLTGSGVIAFASSRSGTAPTFAGIALGGLVFACGVAIIYSVMLIAVSISFYVVKIDNLSHILTALFDTARWPTRIFRGSIRSCLTPPELFYSKITQELKSDSSTNFLLSQSPSATKLAEFTIRPSSSVSRSKSSSSHSRLGSINETCVMSRRRQVLARHQITHRRLP